MCFCDVVFGFFEAEYLKKTQLIGCFFGADNVLMAQLAMLGEVRELGEVLFRLRSHPGRAMTANRSARARAGWYNPSAARNVFIIPCWQQLVWELFKSVRRSSLPFDEKVRCRRFLPPYYRSLVRSDPSRMENRNKEAVEDVSRSRRQQTCDRSENFSAVPTRQQLQHSNAHR
jgi:hypothetical protein